ncbi:MAG: heme utilization cystosolic carrier protein HutX [Alphaproteobacteria bacterium]|nr:heme utilization cystosolic carrier protein HutX [Alphaproteobacteria bacterium]
MRDENAETAMLSTLREKMARSQDGVLEAIAAEHGASTRAVADCLPDHCRTVVDGSAFEAVMADLSAWGEIVLLVHTQDVVLECRGEIPRGRMARGYYNFEGHGPIGGHLRHGRCAAIYFVKRPFMKMDTCAILFFNGEGEAMFKVYVGRDANRRLRADQVARFDQLKARLTSQRA